MSATLQRHAIGLTWIDPGTMVRSAQAVRSDGRVWLIDRTAFPFALGRRAGVHPVLRITPPRSQFAKYRPSMLLVGHGPTLETDAAAALDDALAHARSDIPRFVTSVPRLVRGG